MDLPLGPHQGFVLDPLEESRRSTDLLHFAPPPINQILDPSLVELFRDLTFYTNGVFLDQPCKITINHNLLI